MRISSPDANLFDSGSTTSGGKDSSSLRDLSSSAYLRSSQQNSAIVAVISIFIPSSTVGKEQEVGVRGG